jgi:hypothetical protein
MLTITAVAASKSKTGLFVTGNENPTFEIRRGYFDEERVFPILTVVKLDLVTNVFHRYGKTIVRTRFCG